MLGSWLDISALWCELPLLVQRLPEGWRLPSILGVSSQLAQSAVLIYPIFKYTFPNCFRNHRTILAILTIGAISCLLLSFFWDKTSIIYHEKRSVYLYIFNFFLSLLGKRYKMNFSVLINYFRFDLLLFEINFFVFETLSWQNFNTQTIN